MRRGTGRMATKQRMWGVNIWRIWAKSTTGWFPSRACGQTRRCITRWIWSRIRQPPTREKGKNDPSFRTKLKIGLQLVQRAIQETWPFRAVVADSFYGEDRGFRDGLSKLKAAYVLALKPSHAWWHPENVAGTLQDVAHEAGWQCAEQPGEWVRITRTFRDGSTQQWWALEIVAGPFGPEKVERAIVTTTDPVT